MLPCYCTVTFPALDRQPAVAKYIRKYGNVFSAHVAQAGGLRIGRLSAGYQPAPPQLGTLREYVSGLLKPPARRRPDLCDNALFIWRLLYGHIDSIRGLAAGGQHDGHNLLASGCEIRGN